MQVEESRISFEHLDDLIDLQYQNLFYKFFSFHQEIFHYTKTIFISNAGTFFNWE